MTSDVCCPRLLLLQGPGTLQSPLLSSNQSLELETLGNLCWSPQGTLSGLEPSPDRQEMTPPWEGEVCLPSPVFTPANTTLKPWFSGLNYPGPLLSHPSHSSRYKSDRYSAPSGDPRQEQEDFQTPEPWLRRDWVRRGERAEEARWEERSYRELPKGPGQTELGALGEPGRKLLLSPILLWLPWGSRPR